MAEMLRDYAVKHYKQAHHTIFGHSEGHDLLTNNPMSNPVYDIFLDGTFMDTAHLPNRIDGQNLFIKHMKSKLPEGVEDELKSMVELMKLREWRKLFFTAREKTTTSVISGLHRGIYKACTRNDTLVTMHMVIVSLAFEFGIKGVSRWQKAVYYILSPCQL